MNPRGSWLRLWTEHITPRPLAASHTGAATKQIHSTRPGVTDTAGHSLQSLSLHHPKWRKGSVTVSPPSGLIRGKGVGRGLRAVPETVSTPRHGQLPHPLASPGKPLTEIRACGLQGLALGPHLPGP